MPSGVIRNVWGRRLGAYLHIVYVITIKMRTSVNVNKTRNNSKYIIGLRCISEQFKRVTKLVKLLISTTSLLVTAFENCSY